MSTGTTNDMTGKKSRHERLDLHPPSEQQGLHMQAAEERRAMTLLSARDRELFLKLLDEDAAPNAALSAAAERYKARRVGDAVKTTEPNG